MEERNLRKVMIGTVSSNKMDKTVVVSVKCKFVKKETEIGGDVDEDK